MSNLPMTVTSLLANALRDYKISASNKGSHLLIQDLLRGLYQLQRDEECKDLPLLNEYIVIRKGSRYFSREIDSYLGNLDGWGVIHRENQGGTEVWLVASALKAVEDEFKQMKEEDKKLLFKLKEYIANPA